MVVEEAVDPNERVTPPAFSEESLAALGSFATDTPYTDPDPQILPSSLEAVVASWQRPSEYLQALVDQGGAPCVVQPPLPNDDGTAASRELPNLLESVPPSASEEGAALAEARRALQWMISCMQLVALHAERMEAGCFLWELIHPQTAGRPRVVPSGKYAIKLFDQGAWRLVTVDDRMPFDASGAAILPRSVSRSLSRRLQPPPSPPPATFTPLPPTPKGHAAPPPLLPPRPPPAHPNRLTVPHPWTASEPFATYLVCGHSQTAALELWPLLLAKAVYKLAAGAPSSLSQVRKYASIRAWSKYVSIRAWSAVSIAAHRAWVGGPRIFPASTRHRGTVPDGVFKGSIRAAPPNV